MDPTQCETLQERLRRIERGEVLDVGCDHDRFDVEQLKAPTTAPGEEVDQRPMVRLPRVPILMLAVKNSKNRFVALSCILKLSFVLWRPGPPCQYAGDSTRATER